MSRSVATNSLIHLEREGETERESFVRKTERGRDRGGARERKISRVWKVSLNKIGRASCRERV